MNSTSVDFACFWSKFAEKLKILRACGAKKDYAQSSPSGIFSHLLILKIFSDVFPQNLQICSKFSNIFSKNVGTSYLLAFESTFPESGIFLLICSFFRYFLTYFLKICKFVQNLSTFSQKLLGLAIYLHLS